MGYLKKGSTTSLAASGIFSLIYFGAAYLMRTPASAVPGIRVALGKALLIVHIFDRARCIAFCCLGIAALQKGPPCMHDSVISHMNTCLTIHAKHFYTI